MHVRQRPPSEGSEGSEGSERAERAERAEPDTSPSSAPWTLSVVVPACNATDVLVGTLHQVVRLPGGPPSEIVVVENGSQDGTWELIERIRRSWNGPTRLIAVRCERGIGAAYRAGVALTTGDRVLLTADDLPFGASDIEAVLSCDTVPPFAIGSKAAPGSRVPRSWSRRTATLVFRLARWAALGLRVGDTQGTFVIAGDLARRLVAATTATGFGMTTELVALAVRGGVRPVELPVTLAGPTGSSRIRWIVDGADTLRTLVRLRRRLRDRPGPQPD